MEIIFIVILLILLLIFSLSTSLTVLFLKNYFQIIPPALERALHDSDCRETDEERHPNSRSPEIFETETCEKCLCESSEYTCCSCEDSDDCFSESQNEITHFYRPRFGVIPNVPGFAAANNQAFNTPSAVPSVQAVNIISAVPSVQSVNITSAVPSVNTAQISDIGIQLQESDLANELNVEDETEEILEEQQVSQSEEVNNLANENIHQENIASTDSNACSCCQSSGGVQSQSFDGCVIEGNLRSFGELDFPPFTNENKLFRIPALGVESTYCTKTQFKLKCFTSVISFAYNIDILHEAAYEFYDVDLMWCGISNGIAMLKTPTSQSIFHFKMMCNEEGLSKMFLCLENRDGTTAYLSGNLSVTLILPDCVEKIVPNNDDVTNFDFVESNCNCISRNV